MSTIITILILALPLYFTARLTKRRRVNIIPPMEHERLAEWDRRRALYLSAQRMHKACELAEFQGNS